MKPKSSPKPKARQSIPLNPAGTVMVVVRQVLSGAPGLKEIVDAYCQDQGITGSWAFRVTGELIPVDPPKVGDSSA